MRMAETSRCAAPARLGAALLLMATCFSTLHAQAAGQATDTSKLDKLSGSYASSDEPDVPISIYARNGGLTIEAENSVPVDLSRVSDAEFAFPGPKVTV